MYTVYILQDDENRLYKGLTNNLSRRIQEHRRGKTKSTRNLKNVKVVYKELHNNLETARRRELYLKTAAGRRFIKTKIKTSDQIFMSQ